MECGNIVKEKVIEDGKKKLWSLGKIKKEMVGIVEKDRNMLEMEIIRIKIERIVKERNMEMKILNVDWVILGKRKKIGIGIIGKVEKWIGEIIEILGLEVLGKCEMKGEKMKEIEKRWEVKKKWGIDKKKIGEMFWKMIGWGKKGI